MARCIGMFNSKDKLIEVFDDKYLSEIFDEALRLNLENVINKKLEVYYIDYIEGEKDLIREIIDSENVGINVTYEGNSIWHAFEEEDSILYLAKFLKEYRFKVSDSGIGVDSIEITNFIEENERTIYIYEELEDPETDDRILDRFDTKLSVEEILQIADAMCIEIDYVEEE